MNPPRPASRLRARRRAQLIVTMKQSQEALFCFAVGAGFLAAAAFTWLRARRFVAASDATFGVVVGLREHRGKAVTYAPVISFDGPDGRPVVFTESTASSPPAYAVGDRVKILYRRDDPCRARVNSVSHLYLSSLVFGALGASVFLAGVLIAVFAAGG